ncbi:helix-turn-helix domain-containing protein [uncultured Shewanella sp.]|uniref:helix-turn-helix domain-containing protein n=1 Tax=uncultured Shewanella sp. TaxID=173975 RepID=UPI002630376A|nr:helix-turn-helix domain-containing protein [uncultured Shewanella sp.]
MEDIDVSGFTMVELLILKELVLSPGMIVSRDRLLTVLNEKRSGKSARIIDVLICRIKKKIPVNRNGVDRLQSVRGRGYVYIDEDWFSNHLKGFEKKIIEVK